MLTFVDAIAALHTHTEVARKREREHRSLLWSDAINLVGWMVRGWQRQLVVTWKEKKVFWFMYTNSFFLPNKLNRRRRKRKLESKPFVQLLFFSFKLIRPMMM
jgi:hypothetical protein